MNRDDIERAKFRAVADQARSELRAELQRMDFEAMRALWDRCSRGHLEGLTAAQHQLVGLLAALAIFDMGESEGDRA